MRVRAISVDARRKLGAKRSLAQMCGTDGLSKNTYIFESSGPSSPSNYRIAFFPQTDLRHPGWAGLFTESINRSQQRAARIIIIIIVRCLCVCTRTDNYDLCHRIFEWQGRAHSKLTLDGAGQPSTRTSRTNALCMCALVWGRRRTSRIIVFADFRNANINFKFIITGVRGDALTVNAKRDEISRAQ